MKTSRLKDIVIAILALVNVFLLALLVARTAQERAAWNRTAAELTTLYADCGVALPASLIPRETPRLAAADPARDRSAEAAFAATILGMLNGYEDGAFQPEKAISRAEFATISTRFAKLTGGKSTFRDVPAGYWAETYIAAAADYGWINGLGNGLFGPERSITRAEVATIVNHMLNRAADRDFVSQNPSRLNQFNDLTDPGLWYYYEMVEASNPHDFAYEGGAERWR